MNTKILGVLAGAALASAATAQPSLTFLPHDYLISDISADGTVACGNLFGPYETFRWTEEEGPVLLGGATVPILSVGAGTPDISYDGNVISATILGGNSIGPVGLYATQGRWENGVWQELLPPTGPGGQLQDNQYGSAWGLSGDGTTVTGFYWTTSYDAHPSAWSTTGGLTALPVDPTRSSRANAANYDGSVVVGWEEKSNGAWQSTAWRNGVKIRLTDTDSFCGAEQVNADGSIIVGQSDDGLTRHAAIWRWNGASYVEQLLPHLPGTAVIFGRAGALGVSDDGAIVVGYNVYSNAPYDSGDGWIWTEEAGMVEATDFIESLGLSLPDGYDIAGFAGISADGSAIFGDGWDSRVQRYQSFILRLDTAQCPGDVTTTGTSSGDAGYGEPDGVTNLSDLLYFVNVWNADLGSPTPNPGTLADTTTTGSSDGDPSFGEPDGNVDLADLLFFVNDWTVGLSECP